MAHSESDAGARLLSRVGMIRFFTKERNERSHLELHSNGCAWEASRAAVSIALKVRVTKRDWVYWRDARNSQSKKCPHWNCGRTIEAVESNLLQLILGAIFLCLPEQRLSILSNITVDLKYLAGDTLPCCVHQAHPKRNVIVWNEEWSVREGRKCKGPQQLKPIQ